MMLRPPRSTRTDTLVPDTTLVRSVTGTPVDLTLEEQATIEALTAEQARLEAEYQDADELPDEIDARMGEIETALAAFDDRSDQLEPADIALAGGFVPIAAAGSHSGALRFLKIGTPSGEERGGN